VALRLAEAEAELQARQRRPQFSAAQEKRQLAMEASVREAGIGEALGRGPGAHGGRQGRGHQRGARAHGPLVVGAPGGRVEPQPQGRAGGQEVPGVPGCGAAAGAVHARAGLVHGCRRQWRRCCWSRGACCARTAATRAAARHHPEPLPERARDLSLTSSPCCTWARPWSSRCAAAAPLCSPLPPSAPLPLRPLCSLCPLCPLCPPLPPVDAAQRMHHVSLPNAGRQSRHHRPSKSSILTALLSCPSIHPLPPGVVLHLVHPPPLLSCWTLAPQSSHASSLLCARRSRARGTLLVDCTQYIMCSLHCSPHVVGAFQVAYKDPKKAVRNLAR